MVTVARRRKNVSRGSLIARAIAIIAFVLIASCMWTLNSQLLEVDKDKAKDQSQPNSQEKIMKKFTDGGSSSVTKLGIKTDTDFAIRYTYQVPSTTRATAVECGASPGYEQFFSFDKLQRSNRKEDKTLYERFFSKHLQDDNFKGTYVELGAFDGVRESNSRFYDECLGWKGLLIEGNPIMYGGLVKNRPNAHRMSFAASCVEEGQTVQFYTTEYTNAGLAEHATNYVNGPKVDVPCGPLGPVLEKIFPDGHITFFSLDVEGAERLVLDTIDFDKIRIDIFMIEVENSLCLADTECEVRDKVRAKMKEVGYKRKFGVVRMSDVYVHPDSPYVDA